MATLKSCIKTAKELSVYFKFFNILPTNLINYLIFFVENCGNPNKRIVGNMSITKLWKRHTYIHTAH